MRALLEQLPAISDCSFKLYHFSYAYYPTPWHYHPECELVLVTKSRGKRIIGNHIAEFSDGDLAFIGPNVPHTYRNDTDYYQPDSALKAESIVVHFLPDFLGEAFHNTPEMIQIQALIQRGAMGLGITGNTQKRLTTQLANLFDLHGMPRLLAFLSLLSDLAQQNASRSADVQPLSTEVMVGTNLGEEEKLTKLITYISQHYQRQITLTELADVVSMTEPSVCRFFKKRTRKTLIEFINEVKIGHACQLLMLPSKSVAEIGYESGFHNLSNFNRQFRSIKGINPQEFRRQFIT